jgi:HEPN domain
MTSNSPNDFILLSREYLEAGEVLYQLGKRSRPVVFCYIQSAELFLKGLAQQQGILNESLRKTHALLDLCNALKEFPNELKNAIEQLSPIDPKTTRFRYPTQEKVTWNLDEIRVHVLRLHEENSEQF